MERFYVDATVEKVFTEFKNRRAGIIKALTSDFQELYRKCNPEKDNLSLYGLPNANWCVDVPPDKCPPELPEPAVGINFSRDGMPEESWLTLIAFHSQAWLVATAFHVGAWARFNKDERNQLFAMINSLPTVYEVLNEAIEKRSDVTSVVSNTSSNKPKSNEKEVGEYSKHMQEDADHPEDEEEGQRTVCGACGNYYVSGQFWICCDVCEAWFHGKCVRITPARANLIDKYMCPFCSDKRAMS